jgi:hypothetical protein
MSQGWVCARGACVLVPSGPDRKKHLFMLMIDPVPIEGYGARPMALMACTSSIKAGVLHETACEVKAGEHPFIEHDSFIDYRFTRIEPVELVEANVRSGFFVAKEPCSPELLQKIIRGALVSKRINREHRRILELIADA